jgi:hypothetical protein
LTQDFFNHIDKEFFAVQRQMDGARKLDENEEKIQNVHNFALYEALNEALDSMRPYKNKGNPMPWSSQTRVVRKATTQEQARKMLDAAVE